MFAFSPDAFSGQAFSPAAFGIEAAVSPAPTFTGGARYPIPVKPLRRIPREEDESILMAVLH